MNVPDRIAALEMELRQLKAAQTDVDLIRTEIADTRRLLTKVKSAIAFEVKPVASFASREEDVFQVSMQAGTSLSGALREYLEGRIVILEGRLEEAQQKAQKVVEIDSERVVDSIVRNVT